MHSFLQKSSKVVEEILKQKTDADAKNMLAENKSDLEISQGYAKFPLPKFLSKIAKYSVLTNCSFCKDDSNYIVCSNNLNDTGNKENEPNSTLLIVWNINDSTSPYRFVYILINHHLSLNYSIDC